MEEGGEEEGPGTPLDTVFLLSFTFVFLFFLSFVVFFLLGVWTSLSISFRHLYGSSFLKGCFCLDLGIGEKVSLSHLDTCRVVCP